MSSCDLHLGAALHLGQIIYTLQFPYETAYFSAFPSIPPPLLSDGLSGVERSSTTRRNFPFHSIHTAFARASVAAASAVTQSQFKDYIRYATVPLLRPVLTYSYDDRGSLLLRFNSHFLYSGSTRA
jgi:hypothetical protein